MSNERVTKAADAVEDLRKALELWCVRSGDGTDALAVRAAAHEAVESIDAALDTLNGLRRDTVAQLVEYDRARGQRLDALLGEILVKPVMTGQTAAHGDYQCSECGKVFPVDPADPIESHGAYLDHLAEHDDQADDDEADQ